MQIENSQFTLRPATVEDGAAVVELINAYAQSARGANDITLEEILSEWQQPGFDLAQSSQAVIAPDGRMVGYADVWDMDEVPVRPMVFGRVHPEFQGMGIGTTLLAWLEERSRQVFARVPAHARVAMRTGVPARHQPSLDLLTNAGMVATRYSWEMSIHLEEPPSVTWPLEITLVTQAQRDDALAVYRVKQETFQDHRDSIAVSEKAGFPLWLHRMTSDPGYDPSLWFLAMEGDEIVGIALGKQNLEGEQPQGWIETLGVRRSWRRRGVGLALLQHAFGEFYRRGLSEVSLIVDASSLTGATRLYERAGMYVKESYAMFEKELRPGVELSTQALAEATA